MKLQVSSNSGTKKFRIEEGKTYVLGRTGGNNDIAVDIPYVSSQHLRIRSVNNKLEVTDLGSTNGSYLEGVNLVRDKVYTLSKNQTLYLGNSNVSLVILEDTSSGNSGQAQSSGSGSSAAAAAENKKGLNAMLSNKAEVIIGRSQECDIVINDPTISRKHARVYKKGGQVFVEDLKSVNGIYINRTKTSSGILTENDTLYIGIHPFSLGKSFSVGESVSAISAQDVTKVFSNGFKGLQETSIEIPEKKIVALMGPSGCGKSTLLKALNGDSPATNGTIKVFGQDLYENFDRLKHVIGYVPQDNIVHEDLTVDQSLYYAAKLRLSSSVTEDEIKTRITEVLQALKIDRADIRTNKVAKLSGGQKKRVSIAVEILNKPKILFLDEPTSPLDPETIEEFLKCLQALCEQGTTVVMVTHKPEDLNYVDKVIFMGVAGHLVYEGTREDLTGYFSKNNLIEVYALLSKKEVSASWYNKWRGQNNSGKKPESSKIAVKPEPVNLFRQIFWLCARYSSVKIGNTKNLIIQFLQPIIIAVLLMLTFDTVINTVKVPTKELNSKMEPIEKEEKNGNVSLVFLLAIASVWFGVSNSAKEIVGEKEILKREFMLNMTLSNYLTSKIVVLSVLTCMQVFILQSLVFIRFPDLNNFGLTFAYMSLIGISAILYGLFFSSITSTSEEVMSILPIALMPQIILSGLIQALQYAPTIICSYFMIGRWGTEGLARIQDMNSNANLFMKSKMGVEKNFTEFLYMKDNILTDITFRHNLIALFIISVIMLTAIYLILWSKLKSK
jgi:ABC-type multidrug transport system ATPase subunit